MVQKVALIFDCGATNVRVIAVDSHGNIVAKASVENATECGAENPQWHIWSLEQILQRFQTCCHEINDSLYHYHISGMAVTTFGVDGALVNAQGDMLYPIISWKCPRTQAVMEKIESYLSAQELQEISGIGQFSFNTLYKLIWLKENHPELLNNAHAWLFISSLITHKLTGVMTTDRTMAGTSQLFDLKTGEPSDRILASVGLDASLFPPVISAGEQIGVLLPEIAQWLGLPAHIPVFSAGHDTQFALLGSGAEQNQPVLSSGTWEILMVRTEQVDTHLLPQYPGSTCEFDACAGLYNPGLQWLASGLLERVRQLFWPQHSVPDVYEQMIAEAMQVTPGCHDLRMNASLFTPEAGWTGMSLSSERHHFYRSALEGLALTLRRNLTLLEQIGGFTTSEVVLVGGGSKNRLWNQIKADMLNLPIKVLSQAETTVIGAACFVWYGLGLEATPEAVRASFNYPYDDYQPSEHQTDYHALFYPH